MYFNIDKIGNDILVRDNEGDYRVKNFSPKLWQPSYNTGTHQSIEGQKLNPVSYDNCNQFRQVLEEYRNSGSIVYGTKDVISQYITEHYPDTSNFDKTKLKIFNIDIEVESSEGFPKPDEAKYPITAITIFYNDLIYVWGMPPEGQTFSTQDKNITYKEFSNELNLISDFLDFWGKESPHVITGWNIEFFDIPYIHNRVFKLLGKTSVKKLSPWGIVTEKMVRNSYGKENQAFLIKGVSILDYLALYKKFELSPRENYKLNTIANVELGVEKLDYTEYGNLQGLYEKNYQKFIEYNIKDVDIVERLDHKKKLIDLCLAVAYKAKVNYNSVFSPIATWTSIVWNYLYENGIITTINFKRNEKSESFLGAYVMEPEKGLHKWVASFDLASLYPNIIIQYNLGPDTLVMPQDLSPDMLNHYANVDIDNLLNKKIDLEYLKEENITMSANGYYFKNNKKSFFSVLMEKLFNERKEEKGKMIKCKKLLSFIEEEIKIRGL